MAKSNLGAYQTMVELAKKTDGPAKLGMYILAGGVLIGSVAGAAAGPAIKKGATKTFVAMKRRLSPEASGRRVYTVSTNLECGAGKLLTAEDRFQVVKEIDEGVLIALVGADAPFGMIDPTLLASVSDFEIGDRA